MGWTTYQLVQDFSHQQYQSNDTTEHGRILKNTLDCFPSTSPPQIQYINLDRVSLIYSILRLRLEGDIFVAFPVCSMYWPYTNLPWTGFVSALRILGMSWCHGLWKTHLFFRPRVWCVIRRSGLSIRRGQDSYGRVGILFSQYQGNDPILRRFLCNLVETLKQRSNLLFKIFWNLSSCWWFRNPFS